jgi:hypothetical protein
MRNIIKTPAVGAAIGGSPLFTAGLGIASAQPQTAPDGLVNVSIGEAGVLEDVKATDAAQIAAGVCDIEVGPVNALAESTDAKGAEQSVCTNSLGSVLIQQNGPGQSGQAPGGGAANAPGNPTPGGGNR